MINYVYHPPYLQKRHDVARLFRIMKLTTLILAFACMHVSAASFSQTVSLNIKNKPITYVFSEIEQQTGYMVIYNDQHINTDMLITLNVSNLQLEKVLQQILVPNALVYQLKGKTIAVRGQRTIKQKTSKAGFDVQQRTVAGKVTDEQGEPLEGVSVSVVGASESTMTDAEGNYQIALPGADRTLLFSFIGYESTQQLVGDRTVVNVTLETLVSDLNEVVVVGYGTQKKVNLSGAVETVSAKQLASRSTNNVGLALQGLVPNLTINPNGGQANSTPSFNIRGITSLNGGSPLFLVDGVPTDPADFSRMNSADIQNISILKDASSAAIYGSRAAYGVVLVTTKKGSTENLAINYGSFFNVRKNGRMPTVVLDPFIQTSYKQIMGQPWYNLYSEQEIEYAKRLLDDPSLPSVINNYTDPEQWAYFARTDWFNEIFNETGTSFSNNINVSGKSDKATYYLGAEYYTEKGMLKQNTDSYKKYNIRSNVDYKLTDWWSIGNNTSIQNYVYDRPTNFGPWVFSTAHKINSLLPIKNPDDSWTVAKEGSTMLGNIIGAMEQGGDTKTSQYVIQSQFNTTANLIKDVLNIKADFTTKFTTNKERGWNSDKSIPYKTGPNIEPQFFGWDNTAQISNIDRKYTLMNVYSDFSQRWDKHQINLLAGYSQELERYEYNFSQRKDLILDTYPSLQLATGEATVNEDIYEWSLRSGFFRANYTFDDRFILEANGRLDGSSRFPKNDRFGFFPSFSGAWILSNERFFEPLSGIVNHLKLRASYGSLGNQDVSYYQYIATMEANKLDMLLNGGRPMGIYPPGLVSQNLTWEQVNTSNIGVDITLLSNRFSIAADVFRRETQDMLMKGRTLPNVLGAAEPKVNAADLETKGWELSMAWRDQFELSRSPFSYGMRFVLSDSKAVITKFDNPTGYLNDYYVGQEFGEIWGMETLGFFKDQAEIDGHADQWEVTSYPGDRSIEPGDLKYRDLDNDGKITRGDWTVENPGDFKVIGNTASRYNFGFDVDAVWKGFDLRMLFQGVMKRDWYPEGYKFWGIYVAPWGNVLEHNLDHWTPETPEAYFPRLKSYLANGSGDLSIPQTRYLQNAGYVRLKNLALGYTLPASVFEKIGVHRFRVYLSGENLFEYTPLIKSYDPESLSETEHPFQRTVSLGINITL